MSWSQARAIDMCMTNWLVAQWNPIDKDNMKDDFIDSFSNYYIISNTKLYLYCIQFIFHNEPRDKH